MAITVSAVEPKGDPNGITALGGMLVQKTFKFTLDSSYPTHGYSITPKQVGMDTILNINFASAAAAAGVQGIVLQWDATNSKVIAYWAKTAGTTTLQEVDAGTDLHTFVEIATVTGRGY